MLKNLSEQLDLDQAAVNIKAKTNEGLGPLGRGEAIACWAIASLTAYISSKQKLKKS